MFRKSIIPACLIVALGFVDIALALGPATDPYPPDGAIHPDAWVNLSWSPGDTAVSHDVYFGTDANAVADATTASPEYKGSKALGEESFDPGVLEWGQSYYWRIDAINDASPDSPWRGEVWSVIVGPVGRPSSTAWWRFDDGQGSVANDSAGSAHATIEGATWTIGRTGKALSFDGVDDAVITPVTIDQSEQSAGVTLCAWVCPESIQLGRHQVISSDDGGYDWSILGEGDGNWHVFTGNYSEDTGFTADVGQWQFIAASFEPGTGITFYKNDREVFFPFMYYDVSSNNIAIGYNPGPWDEFFAGKIDEVRIYNRALSPVEINNLFGRSEDDLDLDVDSDNNNMFNLPDRSFNEDAMEDDPCQPGRIVANNNDDNDGDQVPDFADGFNLDGIWGNEDDLCSSQQFVPLAVEIANHIDLEQARVRVTYSESVPANTMILAGEPNSYEPAPGTLRIWAQPGDVQRNAEHIARGGDFVIPSVYNPSHLGFTNSNRTVTWYVEGIQTSWALADREIIVEVDPDGPGPAGYAGDLVRLTIIDMQFMTQGPDGEMIDQEFTYNCVPTPQILATVEDCQIDESGLVTMTISGTVTDQTSGIVADPGLQLQNITISAGNQPGNTIDLVNGAEPEYPWQPYRFQSSFSATVQFQTDPSEEEYYVFLNSSENAAGVAAQVTLVVFYNGRDVSCVEETENGPGTYIPTIMRVDAPEGTFTEGRDTLHAFDSEWPLEYGDFGDGQYFYAMGSHEEVQIFLPALYAGDSSDFIGPVDKLVALVNKEGKKVSFREAVKIHGLIIDNESVKSILDLSLTNFREETYMWGNITKYVYRPRTGWAQNKDNFLDTEIKFRYVNHADTISGSFKSKAQFEAMVDIRKNIVQSARDVKSWGKYWTENAYWTQNATVKSGTASAAIAHAFNHQTDYGMGCYMAAILVMERGWCLHNAQGFNDVVGSNPFGWGGKLYSTVITREGIPATGGSTLLKDKVKWIPGDWGYIKNYDPKGWWNLCSNLTCKNHTDDPATPQKEGWTTVDPTKPKTCPLCGSAGILQGFLQGENIIYTGGLNQGPGKPAIGNFELLSETKFKNTAHFWGHITPREETLQQWFDAVNSWSKPLPSSYKAEILGLRDRIKY